MPFEGKLMQNLQQGQREGGGGEDGRGSLPDIQLLPSSPIGLNLVALVTSFGLLKYFPPCLTLRSKLRL